MQEVIACPWCCEDVPIERFEQKDRDWKPVRLIQAIHTCEKGEFRYKAWEKGW